MSGDLPRPSGIRYEADAPRQEIALVVALAAGKVLVARRDPAAHQGGLWEFPGGKIEAGEPPRQAARRELAEETALEAATLDPLTVLVHDYPDRQLRFHVFLAATCGEPRLAPGREWAWVAVAELDRLEMPPANAPILRALRWRLGGAPE